MKNLVRFVSVVAAYVATTGSAHAVFVFAPVPEPGSLGLLVAGGVAIMAVRYLGKRQRNK